MPGPPFRTPPPDVPVRLLLQRRGPRPATGPRRRGVGPRSAQSPGRGAGGRGAVRRRRRRAGRETAAGRRVRGTPREAVGDPRERRTRRHPRRRRPLPRAGGRVRVSGHRRQLHGAAGFAGGPRRPAAQRTAEVRTFRPEAVLRRQQRRPGCHRRHAGTPVAAGRLGDRGHLQVRRHARNCPRLPPVPRGVGGAGRDGRREPRDPRHRRRGVQAPGVGGGEGLPRRVPRPRRRRRAVQRADVAVGLVPAAVLGLDVVGLLEGRRR